MDLGKLAKIEEEGKRIFLAEQTDSVKMVLDTLLDFRISGNMERLKDIGLFFHTLKGAAGIFKYEGLANIAERMDDYLGSIKDQTNFTHKLFSLLLEGIAETKFELSALYYDKFNFKYESQNGGKDVMLEENNDICEHNTEYIYAIDCKKILCVDDDTVILRTIQSGLEAIGYKVRCIENPLLAPQVIKQFNPDLLILDVMMSEMTGIQLLQKLRIEKVYIPAIFLSSINEKDKKLKAFEVGALDYILKPFDLQELLARIGRISKEIIEHKNDAYKDKITGTFLIALFNENFCIAKRRYLISSEKFCVAVIDFDFKKITEKLGSEKGHSALKFINAELKNHLRATDQIYKSDTNQFVVLFSNSTLNRAFAVLKQCLHEIDSKKKDMPEDLSDIIIDTGLAEFDENENNISIIEHCNSARISNVEKSNKSRIAVYRKEKVNIQEGAEHQHYMGKILIIDDTASIVFMIKSYLEGMNYMVDSASNGAKGLLKCRTMKPDIVILDLMMPEIDGFDVIKTIKTDSVLYKIKLIVVTSFCRRDYISRCMALGVNNILVKPFSMVELESRIISLESIP